MSKVFTIPNFLSSQECTEVLARCISELELKQAGIGETNKVNSYLRKSSTAFIKDLGSINTRLVKILTDNIKIRGSNVSGLGDFQFTEYQIGEFYNWHKDSAPEFSDRFYSTVIQLNGAYTEGALEVIEGTDVITLLKGIGNLYMFPSNYTHRVKPITTGVRYSLVNWVKVIKNINEPSILI
jgi:predicted 2-oxoglutarate/Fe(II)-dependent dioxygenase YbiX